MKDGTYPPLNAPTGLVLDVAMGEASRVRCDDVKDRVGREKERAMSVRRRLEERMREAMVEIDGRWA
jgi:hypothetical protein